MKSVESFGAHQLLEFVGERGGVVATWGRLGSPMSAVRHSR